MENLSLWARRDSNPRPSDYESPETGRFYAILTTEHRLSAPRGMVRCGGMCPKGSAPATILLRSLRN